MHNDENHDINQRYTLGLGRLNSDWCVKRVKHNPDVDKLLFIKQEKARQEEIKKIEYRRSQTLYKKNIYGRPNRSGLIKSLYKQAENLRPAKGIYGFENS